MLILNSFLLGGTKNKGEQMELRHLVFLARYALFLARCLLFLGRYLLFLGRYLLFWGAVLRRIHTDNKRLAEQWAEEETK